MIGQDLKQDAGEPVILRVDTCTRGARSSYSTSCLENRTRRVNWQSFTHHRKLFIPAAQHYDSYVVIAYSMDVFEQQNLLMVNTLTLSLLRVTKDVVSLHLRFQHWYLSLQKG